MGRYVSRRTATRAESWAGGFHLGSKVQATWSQHISPTFGRSLVVHFWRNRGDAFASAVRGGPVQSAKALTLPSQSLVLLPLPSSVRSRIGEVWDSPCGRGGCYAQPGFSAHTVRSMYVVVALLSPSRRALEHQALVDWVVSGLTIARRLTAPEPQTDSAQGGFTDQGRSCDLAVRELYKERTRHLD